MKQVIDVRDMHTAIHSLYLVERKPKTTCQLFRQLSTFNNKPIDEMDTQTIWDEISANVTPLGEILFQYFKGQKFWIGGNLVSNVIYDDGENKYKVIGSYDIWY